jgi:hypothetical protein
MLKWWVNSRKAIQICDPFFAFVVVAFVVNYIYILIKVTELLL